LNIGSVYIAEVENISKKMSGGKAMASIWNKIWEFFYKIKHDGLPYTGKSVEFYDNGQKKSEGNYKKGKAEGLWTSWHKNGQKNEEGNYKNGIKEGLWIEWHKNGQKESEGHYVFGMNKGLWIKWDENGKKILEMNFKNGNPQF
jgi:antitoxin component YwqK of YwqJK toxin-antitoxin module